MALQASPSAQRAVDIVQFLAEHSGKTFSVAGLARHVGQSRATCQAVLLALEASDWVRRQESGGYTLGAGLIAIGAAAARGAGVVELLRSAVNELYASTGREVIACIPAGMNLIAVARAGPIEAYAVATIVGQVFPLVPPLGLPYAAWDNDELDRWLARAPQLDRRERGRLEEAAGLVRELGYGITLDSVTRRTLRAGVDALPEAEREEIIAALAHDEYVAFDSDQRRTTRFSHIAAPVFGADRRVVATLGINLGVDDAARVPEIGRALRAAVQRVGDKLAAPVATPTHVSGQTQD